MMDELMVQNRSSATIRSLGRGAGAWLPVLAVLAACRLGLSSEDMPIPIERPWLLVLGALAAALPSASASAGILQTVLVFYLMSIPLSELSTRYFTIALAARPIGICYSLPVLLLCGIGYGAGLLVPRETALNQERSSLVPAYVLALAVIGAHMLGLFALVACVYGYGFERDLNALGQVSLYLLLLLFSCHSLAIDRVRRILALGLGLGYLALAPGIGSVL